MQVMAAQNEPNQGPTALSGDQSMYYLSEEQAPVVDRINLLRKYVDKLPVWVSHREVATSLGYPHVGIEEAEVKFGVYKWATEFENVHERWIYDEVPFEFDGIEFAGSEQLYQLHKCGKVGSDLFEDLKHLFAASTPMQAYGHGRSVKMREDWEEVKDQVMFTCLQCKFTNNAPLRELLTNTHPFPLVSVKGDSYWGAGLNGRGENRLGTLLQRLRDDLRADSVGTSPSTDEPRKKRKAEDDAT